jgi:feruloyl-CoA synthase
MGDTTQAGSTHRYRAVRLGDLTPDAGWRDDGALIVRARQPLGPYPARFTEYLTRWAGVAPQRTLLSWREGDDVARLTYADALEATRRLGQALLDRGLSADRPLAILSGNSRDHLLLALAAQHVGVPFAPISPAYSLVSRDFGTLKHALGRLTPGLVYVEDEGQFERALDAAVPADVEVCAARSNGGHRQSTPVDRLLASTPTSDVDRAHAAVSPDTIAKILFTSGSTGLPKGVINTHRMLCSNQQMILQALPFLGDEPPVLVDWLPWHHTFGGNHNIGLVVSNGGSLHMDEGRPLPEAFNETVRNLREIAPTVYLNVPKGYEELARALRGDRALAERFFSRLRLLFYAAASLAQHVADEIQSIAEHTCGERLVFVTGLGATETAPMAFCRPWGTELATAIGLPVSGLEAKLVPAFGKLAVRVRGPNVTPGYWREAALTRAAFDDEGFYRMDDAVRLAEADDVTQGFVFDGRIVEDFKLASGTWVNVGPLRARVISHFAPYVRDAVITGHDLNELGMLMVPDVTACRTLCPMLVRAADAEVLRHHLVREHLLTLLERFAALATGSSTRIARALLLEAPPSLDDNEVTDKGSLNQRTMLRRRAVLVQRLHADPPTSDVLLTRAPCPDA